jgi:hypothetical protein
MYLLTFIAFTQSTSSAQIGCTHTHYTHTPMSPSPRQCQTSLEMNSLYMLFTSAVRTTTCILYFNFLTHATTHLRNVFLSLFVNSLLHFLKMNTYKEPPLFHFRVIEVMYVMSYVCTNMSMKLQRLVSLSCLSPFNKF